MKILLNTFVVELLKLRRSGIVSIIIALFLFIPIMMSLLMVLAQHPELAEKLGLIGTKASLFASNDWKGYFEMLNQLMAAIGLLGFGFAISWVFGREHVEHTLTTIIALPINRSVIVAAKFLVAFVWAIVLVLAMFASGLLSGLLTGISGWTTEVFTNYLKIYLTTAGMTYLISVPVAFVAGWSRGIIAPIGCVIVAIILAQLLSMVGLGPVFPWAIPGIYTMQLNEPGFSVAPVSYAIIAITFVLGLFATGRWWNKADHV